MQTDGMKRESDFEEQCVKFERELHKLRMNSEQVFDFVNALKKELQKLAHSLGIKM